MPDPVNVLSSIRRLASASSAVIVMDERVGEDFANRVDDTEWFVYGFSVLHCLPVGMLRENPAGTGTGRQHRHPALSHFLTCSDQVTRWPVNFSRSDECIR